MEWNLKVVDKQLLFTSHRQLLSSILILGITEASPPNSVQETEHVQFHKARFHIIQSLLNHKQTWNPVDKAGQIHRERISLYN